MNKINKIPIFLILILGIGIVGLVIPSKAAIQTQNDPIWHYKYGECRIKAHAKRSTWKTIVF